MATLAETATYRATTPDHRFFLWSAVLMALVLVAGFVTQMAMGRSSFGAPLVFHIHAVVFFGWVVLYVLQNALAARGSIALHRRLGWIGAGWIVVMLAMGVAVTVTVARRATVPFFFQPQHFLVLNPVTLLLFTGLSTAAIVNRRRTDWHKRLHLCAMAAVMGPGFGRLLPMPFMIPWAFETASVLGLAFPVAGMVHDLRRRGRIHPAWWRGVGAIVIGMTLAQAVAYSPVGTAIYRTATAGSPGARVAPLDFGLPPGGP